MTVTTEKDNINAIKIHTCYMRMSHGHTLPKLPFPMTFRNSKSSGFVLQEKKQLTFQNFIL